MELSNFHNTHCFLMRSSINYGNWLGRRVLFLLFHKDDGVGKPLTLSKAYPNLLSQGSGHLPIKLYLAHGTLCGLRYISDIYSLLIANFGEFY